MILTIPGLWNSGPEHWHSHWERELPECRRIEQKDWLAPRRQDWVPTIQAAVQSTPTPIVLAAHSLGCATVAHWAQWSARQKDAADVLAKITGALLVAPSDVEGPNYPREAVGFDPMPVERLPFPSILVASSDDQWVSLERAKYFANCWGSRFVDIGPAGHINSDSRLGMWQRGQELVQELLASSARK